MTYDIFLIDNLRDFNGISFFFSLSKKNNRVHSYFFFLKKFGCEIYATFQKVVRIFRKLKSI